jgi:hypothetical protein
MNSLLDRRIEGSCALQAAPGLVLAVPENPSPVDPVDEAPGSAFEISSARLIREYHALAS